MRLFQVYGRKYSWERLQVRFWRTRLYLESWRWSAGWTVGVHVGSGGLTVSLGLLQASLVFWSHADDCDCDHCMPF